MRQTARERNVITIDSRTSATAEVGFVSCTVARIRHLYFTRGERPGDGRERRPLETLYAGYQTNQHG